MAGRDRGRTDHNLTGLSSSWATGVIAAVALRRRTFPNQDPFLSLSLSRSFSLSLSLSDDYRETGGAPKKKESETDIDFQACQWGD